MSQQLNPYAPPADNVLTAPPPSAGLTKAVIAALFWRYAYSHVLWFVAAIVQPIRSDGDHRSVAEHFDTFQTIDQVGNALFGFQAWLLFAIWFYKLNVHLRGLGRPMAYSAGMTVGAWLIPCANFVLPYLVVRDGWRTKIGMQGGGLVLLWWLTYMGFTFVNASLNAMTAPDVNADMPERLVNILSSPHGPLELAAFATWIMMVQRLGRPEPTPQVVAPG